VKDVAEYLGMSTRFVYEHAGVLGGCKVGRTIKFRQADVDAWVDKQRLIPPRRRKSA
jgi:excisionase family DNA binding protein